MSVCKACIVFGAVLGSGLAAECNGGICDVNEDSSLIQAKSRETSEVDSNMTGILWSTEVCLIPDASGHYTTCITDSGRTMDMKESCCKNGCYSNNVPGIHIYDKECKDLGMGFRKRGSASRLGSSTYADMMCSVQAIGGGSFGSSGTKVGGGWGPNCRGIQVFASCKQLLNVYTHRAGDEKPRNQRPEEVGGLLVPGDVGGCWSNVCDDCSFDGSLFFAADKGGQRSLGECQYECFTKSPAKGNTWKGGCKAIGFFPGSCFLYYTDLDQLTPKTNLGGKGLKVYKYSGSDPCSTPAELSEAKMNVGEVRKPGFHWVGFKKSSFGQQASCASLR